MPDENEQAMLSDRLGDPDHLELRRHLLARTHPERHDDNLGRIVERLEALRRALQHR